MKTQISLAALFTLTVSAAMAQSTPKLTIDATSSVSPVSPTLYGLMTEEINYSYDGGLYAEMIRNRTFAPRTDQWRPVSGSGASISWETTKEGPTKALDHSLKITIASASPDAEAGIANNGYWGMAVRPSTTYTGSFFAATQGVGPATLKLINDTTGHIAAQAKVGTTDGGWHDYKFSMTTGKEVVAGEDYHFTLTFNHPGTAQLQLISLMPPTYHDRVNGNRPDLMKLMAAMNPHFLRLPGGNYLEGNTIKDRFDWKSTIGPLADRPTHQSPWGYRSTDGMGLLEFLEWCEDLKMDPLLAVYAGYSLRGEHVVGAELQPYIQDALDEIEYVTGSTATKWGAERAKDGHPAPFPLKYIEIGNEDFFDKSGSYDQRFTQFAEAIRKQYSTQYKLIATTPVKTGNPDLLDDHYYRSPEEFYGMVHKYDTMDRNGPKIFVGEWATRTGSPTPDFDAALGDAAWMTGMERNSDLILMSSYAPMFVNVNPGGMQWATDLMGYDSLRAFGSPSYWAQVLFAQHLGDHTVKTTSENMPDRVFWSATATGNKMLHLKLVNATDQPQQISMEITGAVPGGITGQSLHGGSKWATNTIEHPDQIVPQPIKATMPSGVWNYQLPANTIQVIEVALRPR